MKMKALVICVCLPLLGGCSLTDILTVFQDRLLSETAMQTFLGRYALSDSRMDLSRGGLTMEQRGTRYFASFDGVGNDGKSVKWECFFLLSHIPKAAGFRIGDTNITFTSNRQTVLFSAPQVTECAGGEKHTYENVVMIIKQEGSKLYFWLLLSDADVAKGRLTSNNGTFKSDDVKAFLAEYADAYALANETVFVFTKR
jgi:hypothetical protein